MEAVAMKPRRFRKTRIAASLATLTAALGAAPFVLGAGLVPVTPPPIVTYSGDPGRLGDPASWRTAEFLRDLGMRQIAAEFAYAAGFAGQNTNVGVVDSGFLGPNPANSPPITVGWTPEHLDANGLNRWISVTADGGTTGPTPGFYNQTYNDSHGTHVSGTVAARRDGGTAALEVTPAQPVASNMHGVAFNAYVSFGNTHKTDGVLYGLLPANATAAQMPDNAYLQNVYPAVAAALSPTGVPVRIIHSSWGSQPNTENFNTYCPPAGGPQSFGVLAAWQNISLPDGVPDGNGRTTHWINGTLAVARSGRAVITFASGNGGYASASPRTAPSYWQPDLEERWIAVSGLTTTGQTFNADGSILVPGTQTFNQCGFVKWACVTAPSNNINSLNVTVSGGVSQATYGAKSGTSMSGPHAAAALNLIMQRFPYMTNEQAVQTMYTTSRQNATTNDAAGASIPNPTRGQIVAVPDTRNGWGNVNLKDAFRGPGQFVGRFAVNTKGYSDVWSNNISDVAIKARQVEDAAEEALWQSAGVTQACVSALPPNSPLRPTDFTAGQARAAARAARVYTGQLTKLGEGTLFLTGNNTYTGVTTISGGKVSITRTITSPVSVSGGILGGSGTIAGVVTALSGTVWPGLSPDEATFINDGVTSAGNTLTVPSIKMGAGATFTTTVRSGSDYTQLMVSGPTAVGGTLMIDLQGAPSQGSVLTVISSGSPIVGRFTGVPEGATVVVGAQAFRVSYLDNKVTLTTL